ncbi:aminotransferase class III-fold pyridoxal phosphate-dependent enzyme [Muricoccus radiodurans]|uniref:aminotransferase class III-fold pyridoxal phosphate-dependent enzyme n=1 Tax=Muricoccus radiodurans TaxID=2231721 RepID=UPI003CEA4BC3
MDAIPSPSPNDLDAYWMPFTANAAFKADPRLFVAADGNDYIEASGRRVLDGMAGLWCVNAGHNRAPIVEAIRDMAGRLDFVSSFSMGHPTAFTFASRLVDIAPEGHDRAFFVNSGSEAVDTALKIARAYHAARGDSRRVRLIGRARAYHGVGFGGLSVAGIARHKKDFGPLLPEVSHLPTTYDRARQAFSRGQPAEGADLAEALADQIAIYGAETIAAVIVEPVTGSGGVFAPPIGYLERLRALCDANGILLIFDEVITGFGRLGTAFAAQRFNVTPDLITTAKGLTNGSVPCGAVLAHRRVTRGIEEASGGGIDLMHGYTYSGHPLAAAAGVATLGVYESEGLFARAGAMEAMLADALHGLRDAPGVLDIRSIGILGAVDIAAGPDGVGKRGAAVARHCLDAGVLIRAAGDMMVLSPPLTFGPNDYDRLVTALRAALIAHPPG